MVLVLHSILLLHISTKGAANGAGPVSLTHLIGREHCHPTSRSCGGPHSQSRLIQTVVSQAAALASQLETAGPSGKSVPECLETGEIGSLISHRKDCVLTIRRKRENH